MLDTMSQPSRAILIFVRVAQIPHEFQDIRLIKSEHKSPEFTALSPFQTVSGAAKSVYLSVSNRFKQILNG